jgi:phytoene synthase
VYAEELLNGMEMDINHEGYKTLQDLEVYCYRVASTVGLMMCYIMGISDHAALKHASDLGLGMQLTNICRDVKEDLENNRSYIPQEFNNESKFEAVKILLSRAEKHYQSGLEGLKYLPWRSAFVIMMAAFFHREIGRKILRTGPSALNHRTVVSPFEKCLLLMKAMILTLFMLPGRIFKRHKPIAIESIWRPV